MMARAVRAGLVLGLGMLLALTPRPVSAETTLWSLVASPLTATTTVSTGVTLTGTNEDPLADLLSSSEIGCIVLDVPVNFKVHSTSVSASNTGSSWVASLSGNRVTVRTTSGGDRLQFLDWVRFTVTATAFSTGSLAWSATAYRDQNCRGTGALLAVPPVVVVLATVTPTPTATPTLLPTLTPLPTLEPLPTLHVMPTAEPTASPPPTPTPSASADSRDAPSTTPESEPSPPDGTSGPTDPSAPPDVTASAAAQSGTPGPSRPATESAPGRDEPPSRSGDGGPVPLSLGPLGVEGGVEVWIIPGVLLGVPGLLVVLFAILQAGGALAWIPAIRRLRGDDRRPVHLAR